VHATKLLSSLKLLLGVLVATCVFTAAASAQQSRFAGKLTLPHEVQWGQATLPAGEYFFRMDAAGSFVVRSAKGDKTTLMKTPVLADSERSGTFLTITTQGNERTVRSLNLPEDGKSKSLIFAPLTKSEREALAKAGQLETVPVIAGKK
jgi:hypothetical protein